MRVFLFGRAERGARRRWRDTAPPAHTGQAGLASGRPARGTDDTATPRGRRGSNGGGSASPHARRHGPRGSGRARGTEGPTPQAPGGVPTSPPGPGPRAHARRPRRPAGYPLSRRRPPRDGWWHAAPRPEEAGRVRGRGGWEARTGGEKSTSVGGVPPAGPPDAPTPTPVPPPPHPRGQRGHAAPTPRRARERPPQGSLNLRAGTR